MLPLGVFGDYQVAHLQASRIVRGRLMPGLRADDPVVREMLDRWPGPVYVEEAEDGADVVLVRSLSDERPRWWLHGALLLATLLTTLLAGALMQGVDPLSARPVDVLGLRLPLPTDVWWSAFAVGAPFALPFLVILLVHELGHYVAALHHRVSATPPYFIPFPPYWSIIGTLGAFIRIKGPTVRRSILFDIGAAGPIASFLLSVPILAFGLILSSPVAGSADPSTPFVIYFGGQPIWLGSGLLTQLLGSVLVPGSLGSTPVLLHPVAFAGWLGLFFTALNLLPFGQLDGGHVLYALSGHRQARVARLCLLALLPLGLLWWGWWFWAFVAIAVSRGRLAHPPVMQESVDLDPTRRTLAWCCVAIFVMTLVPLPVSL